MGGGDTSADVSLNGSSGALPGRERASRAGAGEAASRPARGGPPRPAAPPPEEALSAGFGPAGAVGAVALPPRPDVEGSRWRGAAAAEAARGGAAASAKPARAALVHLLPLPPRSGAASTRPVSVCPGSRAYSLHCAAAAAAAAKAAAVALQVVPEPVLPVGRRRRPPPAGGGLGKACCCHGAGAARDATTVPPSWAALHVPCCAHRACMAQLRLRCVAPPGGLWRRSPCSVRRRHARRPHTA